MIVSEQFSTEGMSEKHILSLFEQYLSKGKVEVFHYSGRDKSIQVRYDNG